MLFAAQVALLIGMIVAVETNTETNQLKAVNDDVSVYEWYKDAQHYWPFEGATHEAMHDAKGKNQGKINGDVRSIPGIVGDALEIGGKRKTWVDFGRIPGTCLNDPMACKTGFTVAFWLKLPNFQGNKIIIQLGQNRHSRGFTVWMRRRVGNKINFRVNTLDKKFQSMLTWPSIHWTHVTIVWRKVDPPELNIYFNCSMEGNAAQEDPDSKDKQKISRNLKKVSLVLGASHGHNKNAHVMLDEFAIWNTTLSGKHICQVMRVTSVHGGYSEWSEFSACSSTCGNGTRSRERRCTNPKPRNRGLDCTNLGNSQDMESCFVKECPIHGNYTEWTEFSTCSQSCGGGSRYRNRTCSNPAPQRGGKDCLSFGKSYESVACNSQNCPVNGGYTAWSEFTSCNASCGDGFQWRNRTCTNPIPKYGGNNCSHLGVSFEFRNCTSGPCLPIDGGYTSWRSWTLCTRSCGGGLKFRTRQCENPKPQYGGRNCTRLGKPFESAVCNTPPCPIDGKYTAWSQWSTCTKACENGTSTRMRTCTNPEPRHGGLDCPGAPEETEERNCNPHRCPIHGGYSEWSSFTACTQTCGGGFMVHNRTCTNPVPQHNGNNCTVIGPDFENAPCNVQPCPVHGNYTSWSEFTDCSKFCENGTRFRYRNCSNPVPMHGGGNCSHLGEHLEYEFCNTHMCPVDGGYTQWTNFTLCSKNCGNGTMSRNRTCTNPSPNHDGKDCTHMGPPVETVSCNTHPCPVHGNYTAWSQFTNCSKSCENGTRYRFRNCTNPAPLHGGRNCSHLGRDLETELCNIHYCPINGGYTAWSNFTECSKSCNNGTSSRNRTCSNPAPKHGGQNCTHLGLPVEIFACNIHFCPIHGGYTSWSNFTSCTTSCGNGTRYRYRNCTDPAPQHDGNNCTLFGASQDIESCNVFPCPIHGGYTFWSNFTSCTTSCGNGTRYRYRNCTDPAPQHNGNNCTIIGAGKDIEFCNVFPCPIHGGYTFWSNFTSCTTSCGNGTRYRYRNCTDPAPQHNGNNCTIFGASQDIESCNVFPCPIHGGYTPWSAFSECSKSCGLGEQVRMRNCTNPAPKNGGSDCQRLGAATGRKICVRLKHCPVNGGYTEWSEFGNCTKLCGNGTTSRHRSCSKPSPKHGGSDCTLLGSAIDTKSCNEHPCPIHGGYTTWSDFSPCTKSCGGGTSTRFRNCSGPAPRHGGSNCSILGPNIAVKSCNDDPCPIDGGYTEWSAYSSCDKSCGGGRKRKERTCTNPSPRYGGRDCSILGSLSYEISCNAHPCPVHGNYSEWSEWSNCDKSCNNGTQYRTRLCDNPSPRYGGSNCSLLGPAREILPCFLRHCPIDGGYGNWSEFTRCTKSCGTGGTRRTRKCDNPEPKYGGRSCERLGEANETRTCNTMPCPIDGNYTEWSGYMPCSVTCGGGARLRVRNCTNPTPMYGGRSCSHLGLGREVIPCNEHRCPDIVFNLTLNLTEEVWDPQLEVQGSKKYLRLKNKIMFNIDVLYYAGKSSRRQLESVKVWRFRQGSVLADVSLYYNNKNYQGITLVHDAVFQQGRIEFLRVKGINFSTIDVPSRPPAAVSGTNLSSTAIRLQWEPINTSYSNGAITGYRVSIEDMSTRIRRSIKGPIFRNINSDVNSYNITGLKKHTWYKLRVAGKNRRGVGIESMPIQVITDEAKPTAAPHHVTAFNISSTSVIVTWSALSDGSVPGILQGYRLLYSPVNNVPQEGGKDVSASTTRTELKGLDMFTEYRVAVSGFTSKGAGPSVQVNVWTDEDVPSKPPPNVTVYNTSSTSIYVNWQHIPSEYIHGILRGFTVSYLDAEAQTNNWTDINLDKSATSCEITSLDKYTKYCVQAQGLTVKGEGMPSKSVCLHTDEDKPDGYPLNVTGLVRTSEEFHVEWLHITRKEWNGRSRGYRVFYKAEDEKVWQIKFVEPKNNFVTLRGLQKFTWYDIRVAAFTDKGLGPKSPAMRLRTKEDVPSKPVINLTARNASHTSILVKWKPIEDDYVHGVLRGFRIIYWVKGTPEDDAASQVAGPDVMQSLLKDLLIYTTYAIEMVGFTSVGNGTFSRAIFATTDEYTPGAPPINVFAANKSGPYHIKVSWDPIRIPYDVHGRLLGYRVLYTPVDVANKTLKPPQPWKTRVVGPTETRVIIRNLTTFTRYHVTVMAFTIKGDGVRSPNITVETCNCNSTFYTNWWTSPPYVEDPLSLNNTGIIPSILTNVISTCCGNCSEFESGMTEIDYEWGNAKKKGLQQFRDGIEQHIELSFPVFGFMSQSRYSGDFGFVPLVQSPGVALIVIGDAEGTASRLLIRSIMLCWPIILLDMMLLWVMSIVIWFVETYSNSRHFPNFMLHGIWEGMWWAFASMTTLGYGDRIPRSYLGRVIGVIWILIGVILIACFNSTMTTLLTARILDKEVMLYGTKVAAIQNSSEYRLGVRKNALINSNGKAYSNLAEVYEALVNRDVKGVLVDAYTVGSRKKLFSRPDLRISKLLDYKSAYGVVLGGDGRKLQQCFQTYLSEQRSEVSSIIERNVQYIEVSGKSVSVNRSKGLFDPNFPTYIRTMIIFSVILALILILGAKFECAKKIGWISFKQTDKSSKYKVSRATHLKQYKEEVRHEMSLVVRIFKHNCEKKMLELRLKHRKELQHLAKSKKLNENGQPCRSSLRQEHLWDILLSKRKYGFTSSLKPKNRRGDSINGLFPFRSPFSKNKQEVETVV